jgi:cytochrome c
MRNTWIFLAGIATIGVGLQVATAGIPHAAHVKAKTKYADVQKILDTNCIRCHGGGRPRGGINLTKYETVMKGGEDGPVIVAGDLKKSVLYQAVSQTSKEYRAMPPSGPKLSDKDLKTIEHWIKEGAKK